MSRYNLFFEIKSDTVIILLFLVCLIFAPLKANADGKKLLLNCEMTLAYLEERDITPFLGANSQDLMLCAGYVQGVIDLNYQYQATVGKDALFCLPPKKLDRKEGIRVVIDYLRSHEKELAEADDYLVTVAFSSAYPCIPLIKQK